ncbi:triose-phosphate transporter family-domain-containing protein [Mrakia frigida]|uniref:triose-phosphate transporter family-domain-containing protein n=1 Tax=Mrakia frigida TaxID=29902 RepID=UPI003FCC08AB
MLFPEGSTTEAQDQEDKDGHSHPSTTTTLNRSSSHNNEKAASASASAQAPLKIPTSRQAFNAPRTPGDLDADIAQFPREKDSSFQQGPSYHPLTNSNTAATTPAGGKKEFKDSEAYWLGLYFFFNLGLTLFNKIVLVSFPFPYTLTGLHALSGCAGCYVALERGSFTPAHLTSRDNLVLALFSVLYTINIAVSNLSLQLVTVPFHQVVRAATPLFTILISVIFLRAKFSGMKVLSLLPVIAGVGFATYGDYNFTAWGLILTLLGTGLASLKTVVTNLIQTGGGGRLKLHPLDLLMRMSPLAFIQCVMYGWWSGELERVRRYGAREMTGWKAFGLFVNGVIAFGLNVVSFTANKKTSALTMTVAANVKQVLTIVLAVIIFDLSINPTNMLGIVLTLAGGAGYAYIEFQEKQKKARRVVL